MKASTKRSGKRLLKKWNRKSHEVSIKGSEHIKANFVERLPHARKIRLLIVEWGLLIFALIILAVTQAIWYHNSYSDNTYVKGGTYTEGTLGKINSFNPLFANTDSENVLSRLMFATLTAPDYTGHYGNALASSVASSDNAKVWTVKLRDNLKWSDGEPITNEDVIFTVGLIQSTEVKSSYASNLSGVKVSEQDGNIIFTLKSAYVNFDSALEIPILPKHALKDVSPNKLADADFNNHPVTSGPFTFKGTQAGNTEVSEEKAVFLNANTNYYQGKPMIDTFSVRAYNDTDHLKQALKTGVINATAALSSSDAPEVVTGDIQEKQTAINSGVFAFFNTKSTALSNKTVRQAIRQGLDMNNLREILHGETPLNYPILESQLSLTEWPTIPATDKEAAKQTLQQLGINKDTPLQITTVNVGYMPEIANRMSAQLQGLGFATNVTVYEPDQNFLTTAIRQRSYDILIYEIELGAEPDLFAYYHSSQSSNNGLNLSNYHNAITDDALLTTRTSRDQDRLNLKYSNFLKSWVDNVPAIGIYQVNLSYYLNKNFRSFSEDNKLISDLDRFTDVRFWAANRSSRYRTP